MNGYNYVVYVVFFCISADDILPTTLVGMHSLLSHLTFRWALSFNRRQRKRTNKRTPDNNKQHTHKLKQRIRSKQPAPTAGLLSFARSLSQSAIILPGPSQQRKYVHSIFSSQCARELTSGGTRFYCARWSIYALIERKENVLGTIKSEREKEKRVSFLEMLASTSRGPSQSGIALCSTTKPITNCFHYARNCISPRARTSHITYKTQGWKGMAHTRCCIHVKVGGDHHRAWQPPTCQTRVRYSFNLSPIIDQTS